MTTLSGSDAVMKALEDIARKMGGGSVSVGFMDGATYPGGQLVAAVAYWNEFGKEDSQPPRPFFRNMIAKESPSWAPKMAKLAKVTNYDGKQVLSLMGEDIKGALQQSINNLTEPKLSPVTLMLREIYGNKPEQIRGRDVGAAAALVAEGFSGASGSQAKPLVWTGHMLNSITYDVSE